MSTTPSKPSGGNGGNTLRIVLFAVLGLLLIGLAYDYLVARPGVDAAYDKIAARSVELNKLPDTYFTNSDVQELLGKQPSRTFEDSNGELVEVFSWRSGLPIKTHDLFAVYKPSDGKMLFNRHAKFAYESSNDVSIYAGETIVLTDEGPTTPPGMGGGGSR
ncbi:hypothetical protein Pla22_33100 [Rubripirellula amarantea]|uniref:Uncharacterized protein n=1 Tax=Rubripirellula amarantea TaxID=2527999 RepID=A0A5C5WJ28_9BACT|nr:hypothetical protein [Rubripirellula amarantea]TWT50567.1 hypothetical protein Pla22_33100 [Rubripirellula amarantea]